MELRSEGKETREREGRNAVQRVEADHAHTESHYVANDQTDEDGERTDYAFTKDEGKQACQERYGTYSPVDCAAEVGCPLSAAEAVGADGQQRDTDSRHHCCRHDMGNEFCPFVREESETAFHNATNDYSSHQCAHALGCGNDDGEGKEGEGDAHDDGKA